MDTKIVIQQSVHKTYVESRGLFPKRYFMCAGPTRAQADPDTVPGALRELATCTKTFPTNFTGTGW